MKKLVIILTSLLACSLLAACGDKTEQEDPWIGIAPGSDLTAVTERTEYYDLIVETDELFDLGLWEKNPEMYYAGDIERLGITVYNLLGTQFAMGEPIQLWSEATPSGVNIYLYKTDGGRELLLSGLSDDDSSFVDARYAGYVDGRGWQTGEETKDEKKKLEEGLQRFGCFVPDGERLLGVRLLQQGTGGAGECR